MYKHLSESAFGNCTLIRYQIRWSTKRQPVALSIDISREFSKLHIIIVQNLLINLVEDVYDEDSHGIHAIVDSAPVLHVSFVPRALDDDPFPAVLPMIGCTDSFTAPYSEQTSSTAIYLHGYISSRLIKLPALACCTTTLGPRFIVQS